MNNGIVFDDRSTEELKKRVGKHGINIVKALKTLENLGAPVNPQEGNIVLTKEIMDINNKANEILDPSKMAERIKDKIFEEYISSIRLFRSISNNCDEVKIVDKKKENDILKSTEYNMNNILLVMNMYENPEEAFKTIRTLKTGDEIKGLDETLYKKLLPLCEISYEELNKLSSKVLVEGILVRHPNEDAISKIYEITEKNNHGVFLSDGYCGGTYSVMKVAQKNLDVLIIGLQELGVEISKEGIREYLNSI